RVGGVEFDVFGSGYRLVRVLARLRVPALAFRSVDLQIAQERNHDDAAAVLGDVDDHDAVRASSLDVRGIADSFSRFDPHPGVRTDDQEILVVDLGLRVVDVRGVHVECGDLVELGVEPLFGAPGGRGCREHQYGDNAGRYPQCPRHTTETSLSASVRTCAGSIRFGLRLCFAGRGLRGGGGAFGRLLPAVVDDTLQPGAGLFDEPGRACGDASAPLFTFGFLLLPLVVGRGEPGDGVVDAAAVLSRLVDRFHLVGHLAVLLLRRFAGTSAPRRTGGITALLPGLAGRRFGRGLVACRGGVRCRPLWTYRAGWLLSLCRALPNRLISLDSWWLRCRPHGVRRLWCVGAPCGRWWRLGSLGGRPLWRAGTWLLWWCGGPFGWRLCRRCRRD